MYLLAPKMCTYFSLCKKFHASFVSFCTIIKPAESNMLEIVSGFPVAYPSAPLLNDNVTLECVAFGG